MIRGKPKQPNAKIAAHASGDSQAADAFAGLTDQAKKTRRKPDPTKARTTHKGSLLKSILADSKLDKDAARRVVNAGIEGLGIPELASLVVYEIEVARRAFEDGSLVSKDYIVALNKIASQVAAAAQLSAAQPGGLPSKIEVTFTTGDDTKPDIGDIVDVE